MRHLKKGNHLGRTASHKKAMMRNMAAQVIEHKEIRTTLAKAKELRTYVERMITYGKRGSLHHRRLAFKFLQNKEAVTVLFDTIAPSYESRNGGYTRILRLGNRKGDNAEIAIIQLVGFETLAEDRKPIEKVKESKKSETSHAKDDEKIVEAEKVEAPVEEEPQKPSEEKDTVSEKTENDTNTDEKADEKKSEEK